MSNAQIILIILIVNIVVSAIGFTIAYYYFEMNKTYSVSQWLKDSFKLMKISFYKRKVITRQDGTPYLIRYSLFACKWFAFKIHKILISDPSCQHDHPWAFITFLIKGGYVEHTPKGSKLYSRFSLLYRKASYQHRLEIHQPVWSFVITFKKVREWGFFTNDGWLNWRKYSPFNTCDEV